MKTARIIIEGHLSVKETAEKRAVSVRRINQYIPVDRIQGCEKPERMAPGVKTKSRSE